MLVDRCQIFLFPPLFSFFFCLPLSSISPMPLPQKTLCLFFLSLVSVKDDSDFVFVSGKLQINYEEKPMIIKVRGEEGRPSASIPARMPRTCLSEIPPQDAAEREGTGFQLPKMTLSPWPMQPGHGNNRSTVRYSPSPTFPFLRRNRRQ